MRFDYELSGRADRYLRRLPPARRAAIVELFRVLCEDPFDPRVSAPLHGELAHLRRARSGNLRVLFEVFRDRLVIYVAEIGPRGDVYKG